MAYVAHTCTGGLITYVSHINTISPPRLSLNYQNQTRTFQRGLLRRSSMDLRHHASAFTTRRVQLMMLLLLRGIGPTPFGLRGSLCQQLATSSPAIRGGGSTMTTCLPPSTGMARISPTVSPSQNWLWPWSDADRLPRSIRWRIGWPRMRPELRVRYLS